MRVDNNHININTPLLNNLNLKNVLSLEINLATTPIVNGMFNTHPTPIEVIISMAMLPP